MPLPNGNPGKYKVIDVPYYEPDTPQKWRTISQQLAAADYIAFQTKRLYGALTMAPKKYPHSKWSDLAAYHLIDNKLCGEWEALAKCPEMEAAIYVKYADEHPQSPKTPEALYKAAWRYSALVEIYTTDKDQKKAEESATRSLSLAKKLVAQYPNDTNWSARGERLIYMVTNKIPTWGNTVQ